MTKSIRVAVLTIVALVAVNARAAFDDVVRAVSARTRQHRVWIPFLGVARMAVWCSHPKGVHDFELATFEGRDDATEAGPELGAILRQEAGHGFEPLVQVRAKGGREWTYIFARPAGDSNVELMIATRDRSDTTVVRVVLDADRMLAEINRPERALKLAGR